MALNHRLQRRDKEITTMLRLFLLMILAWLPLLSTADESESIDRLFFTPSERTSLDQLRNNSGYKVITPTVTVDQITLDGVVKPSSGKSTTWINQQPQYGNKDPQGITVLGKITTASALTLQLPSGKIVDLRAGQSFDVHTGKISEVYDSGLSEPPKILPKKIDSEKNTSAPNAKH